jgi:hypothetical protein
MVLLMILAVFYMANKVRWRSIAHMNTGEQRSISEIDEANRRLSIFLEDGETVWVEFDELKELTEGVPWIEFGVKDILAQANWRHLLLAVGLVGFAPLLGVVRLMVLLAVHDIRPGFWTVLKIGYAGNFLNLFLPGLVTGDVLKAYYFWKYTEKRGEVVTIVFADRIIGVVGLLTLAALAMLGAAFLGSLPNKDIAVRTGGLLCICIIGGCLFFSHRVRRFIRLDAILARLPLSDKIDRLDKTLMSFRYHKRSVVAAVALTILLQLIVIISTIFIGRAIAIRMAASNYFAVMPLGFLAAGVPILPQGFGQMEFVLIEYLARTRLASTSQALMLAIGSRMIQWVWALPGGLVLLFGGHRPSADELKDQLEEASSPQNDRPDSAAT